MSDDRKKVLEATAAAVDRAADWHESHGCATPEFLRSVSGTIRSALATSQGPAQVATPAYRDNWETLFGKKQTIGQA